MVPLAKALMPAALGAGPRAIVAAGAVATVRVDAGIADDAAGDEAHATPHAIKKMIVHSPSESPSQSRTGGVRRER